MPTSRSPIVPLALPLAALCACAGSSGAGADNAAAPDRPAGGDTGAAPPVDIVATQTVAGLGAGQGIALRGGFVYLYGDADTGVIREFRFESTPEPRLAATGRDVRLTRGGDDVIPHPTGLTFHPEHGAILGNTVSGEGTIHFIDFDRLLADGTLDAAMRHTVRDDAAVNGTRPEILRWNGARYVGTSDYGGRGNELRLYDPDALRQAARTSEPGVVAARMPCGGFVQSLHWIEDRGVLVFARNRAGGRGYRLAFADLAAGQAPAQAAAHDVADEDRELEGFALLEDGWVLLLNADPEDNLQIARLRRPL